MLNFAHVYGCHLEDIQNRVCMCYQAWLYSQSRRRAMVLVRCHAASSRPCMSFKIYKATHSNQDCGFGLMVVDT